MPWDEHNAWMEMVLVGAGSSVAGEQLPLLILDELGDTVAHVCDRPEDRPTTEGAE